MSASHQLTVSPSSASCQPHISLMFAKLHFSKILYVSKVSFIFIFIFIDIYMYVILSLTYHIVISQINYYQQYLSHI
jgi:hypothetical protein